jgi:hypothetical protein
MLLGAAATAAAAGMTTASDFFKHFASQVSEDGLSTALIDGIWAKLQERVAAHSMVNYRDLVAKLLKQ